MRKLLPRAIGIALIAGSCGTTWLHRLIWESARNGPPQATELAIGLTTFVLASVGVLLLVHGANLFDRKARGGLEEAASCGRELAERLMDPVSPAGCAFDTKHGVAAVQARRGRTVGNASSAVSRSDRSTLPVRRERL